MNKNGMHIAIALEKAWEAGKRSTHLDQLCTRILQIGAQAPTTMAAPAATVAAPAKVQRAPAQVVPPN